MAVNLSALAQIQLTAQTLANVILVTPQQNTGYQPQTSAAAIDQFLFDYEGENTTTLDADITDHYIETNTTIQDHIAQKPIMVTTRGFIAELNDIVPAALAPAKLAVDKLTILSAYTPALTVTAQIAFNTAVQAAALASLATNAVKKWSTVDAQNKQQVAFQKLQTYYTNRTLFTIQTPWAKYQNMAIKTLRAIQEDSTRVISEFEITFKQINFATTTQQFLVPTGQGRWNQQSASPVDLGVGTTVPSAASVLGGLP